MPVDTQNAHIRQPSRQPVRNSPGVQAHQADRLLNDPAFTRAFEQTEEAIVNLIAQTQSDGSAECEAAEREMCRTIRTLRGLKRVIMLTVQGHQLRLADFKPETENEG